MVNTQKKAISPVVATALLLVVAVVAVVGFQTWFNTYQSENFAKLNEQTAAGSAVTFNYLTNTTVYLVNSGSTNLPVDIEVETCDPLTSETLTAEPSLNEFTLTNCGFNKGQSVSILVKTDEGLFPFTGTVQ